MTIRDMTGSEQQAVRLDRADMVRTDDGHLEVPVVLSDEGRQVRGILRLDPDDAARLHAQLDRRLNGGWAMTEQSQMAKQTGGYPVSGPSHHLRED